MARKKKKNTPDKDGSYEVCKECPSICCHDLAMEIYRPRTKHDIENCKWYLHFDTVDIRIRNGRWHLNIKGRCKYLDENDMCTIYDRRPQKCRDHNPPDCERFGKWYDVNLTEPEDVDWYLTPEHKRKPRRRKKKNQ